MNRHGVSCDCASCIELDDQFVLDVTQAVDKNNTFCLNEELPGSCKTVFKAREDMLDRSLFVRSNEDDSDLMYFIPLITKKLCLLSQAQKYYSYWRRRQHFPYDSANICQHGQSRFYSMRRYSTNTGSRSI